MKIQLKKDFKHWIRKFTDCHKLKHMQYNTIIYRNFYPSGGYIVLLPISAPLFP